MLIPPCCSIRSPVDIPVSMRPETMNFIHGNPKKSKAGLPLMASVYYRAVDSGICSTVSLLSSADLTTALSGGQNGADSLRLSPALIPMHFLSCFRTGRNLQLLIRPAAFNWWSAATHTAGNGDSPFCQTGWPRRVRACFPDTPAGFTGWTVIPCLSAEDLPAIFCPASATRRRWCLSPLRPQNHADSLLLNNTGKEIPS